MKIERNEIKNQISWDKKKSISLYEREEKIEYFYDEKRSDIYNREK